MVQIGFGYIATVQEFYEYMKEQGKTDYKIHVQYRDEGGDYYGEDERIRLDIEDDNKAVIL